MTRALHPPCAFVLADDLSGAAECAAEWALRGHRAHLQLHEHAADPAGVVVLDLDNRNHGALRLDESVLRRFACAPIAYLKVDSRLRGAWAPLLAALVNATGRKAVLCPALPRLGRGVRGGRIVLSEQESRRLAGSPGFEDDIAAHLRCFGLDAAHIAGHGDGGAASLQRGHESAASLRRALDDALDRHSLVVVDASSSQALEVLATALADVRHRPFAVGSAGLAGAIAQRDAVPADAIARRASELPAPMAFMIGSDSPTAQQQLASLEEATATTAQRWGPEGCGAPAAAGPLRLYAIRQAPSAARRELADGFARWALPALADARTVVVTGGETARALCEAAAIDVLEVLGEVEPGICVATAARAGSRLHLVVKSGTFGDRDALRRVAGAPAPVFVRSDGD